MENDVSQALDNKSRHFLDLLNGDLYPIESLYAKGGSWIKYFEHSNSLCMRAIINHISIREYHLCFFHNENFSYLCSNYLIELRHYILHNCRRFNNYWNLKHDTISHFMLFLEFNKNTFLFRWNIIS